MAFTKRADVEKGKRLVALEELQAGNLACELSQYIYASAVEINITPLCSQLGLLSSLIQLHRLLTLDDATKDAGHCELVSGKFCTCALMNVEVEAFDVGGGRGVLFRGS